MKKSKIKIQEIILRYIIILILSFNSLALFYLIFTPLTIYPVYFLFSLVFESISFVSMESTKSILINRDFLIELIPACIAGSAYFLLLMLNLSTPNIKLKKRISALVFSFGIFLLINILRIFIFGILAYSGYEYFDFTHWFFWYFISTLFVVGIWFAEIKIFRIKEIPFYSDIKFFFEKSAFRRKNRK